MASVVSTISWTLNLKNLANPKDILIGYHAGCPDGVASAYILRCALNELGFAYKIVPIGHSGKKFSEYVQPGQTVFSLDVSPSVEDIEALQDVEEVIILDHHASEVETQQKLIEALPNKVVNLSDLSGKHCGASLVHRLVMANVDGLSFDADVIDMVHKMDVFQHKMSAHLDASFLSFKSFLIQDGERNVSMELMETMFTEKDRSIAIGRDLAKPIIERTEHLFKSADVLLETPDFRVLFCRQHIDCRPVDFFSYQELIDTKIDGKPTLFLTQDEVPNAKGIFNLGLRRAGENMDVSKVAKFLKENRPSTFVSGGGHMFAGGLQSNSLVEVDEIVRSCAEALTHLHPHETSPAWKKPKHAADQSNGTPEPASQPSFTSGLVQQPLSQPVHKPSIQPPLQPSSLTMLQPSSHPALQLYAHPILQPANQLANQLVRQPLLSHHHHVHGGPFQPPVPELDASTMVRQRPPRIAVQKLPLRPYHTWPVTGTQRIGQGANDNITSDGLQCSPAGWPMQQHYSCQCGCQLPP